MRYVAEYDETVPDSEEDGKSIVVKTTDGPKGSEPQPLFWTGTKVVRDLIKVLADLVRNSEGVPEDLHDLDRNELRSLAWEALLISDGPDRIEGEVSSTLQVRYDEEGGSYIFHLASPNL